MKNLHEVADEAYFQRHVGSLKELAEYHYQDHMKAWKAFYEGDGETRFYGGALLGRITMTPFMKRAMQHYVDLGLAPTAEQVGARPWLVVWAHRLYGQSGEAALTLMKAWSADFGARLDAFRHR